MLAFIHFCMGHGFSLPPQANSFDGADGAASEGCAAGARVLKKVVTAPITIREEMWSLFMRVLGNLV